MTAVMNQNLQTRAIQISAEQASMLPILISKKQCASLLNLSLRTVTNLIREKKLRPRKIGRRCMLSYRQVVQFAERKS